MIKVKTDAVTERHADRTVAVVEFELPEPVVQEIREAEGDLDPDEISDRVRVCPLVDGEKV